MAYLYGASIQGIQGYIFETNRLKEIVGASNLIEYFCSKGFLNGFFKNANKTVTVNILRNAGGNIRLLFDDSDKDKLETLVKQLPKYIMERAYGITVSQAVVRYDESNNDDYLQKIDELEKKLIEARNVTAFPLDPKISIIKQNPRTGKPLYKRESINSDEILFDKGSWQKDAEAQEGHWEILFQKMGFDHDIYNKFPLELSEISQNGKIAIIHADGNKMGLLLQQMKEQLQGQDARTIQDAYRDISKQIEEATLVAVKDAYNIAFKKYEDKEKVPFRPIVIGGDDITMICPSNEAIKFTKTYLEKFEHYTKEKFATSVKEYGLDMFANGLTACAGIAFSNEKFPFHYAAGVAEALCGFAKKESKREASCLMFHNIQSSYFDDYSTYVEHELTANGVSFRFGPYYLRKSPNIDALMELFKVLTDESIEIPTGKLREWLNELHRNGAYAKILLDRFDAVLKKEHRVKLNDALKELDPQLSITQLICDGKTPIYDVLQLKNAIGANDGGDDE